MRSIFLSCLAGLLMAGCGAVVDTGDDAAPTADEQALVLTADDDDACASTVDELAVSDPTTSFAAHVGTLFDEVRDGRFPELAGLDVTLRVGEARDAILRTSISTWSIFKAPERRRYFVIVSSRFADAHPDDDALRAILVHELSHIVDYTRMSRGRLLEFLAAYVASPNDFVPRYERDTDLRALERADRDTTPIAPALSAYREWLYQHLDPELVATKRRNYLQPEEIATCATEIATRAVRSAPCTESTTFSTP